MRRTAPFGVVVVPVAIAACSSLYGATDVPVPDEGGAEASIESGAEGSGGSSGGSEAGGRDGPTGDGPSTRDGGGGSDGPSDAPPVCTINAKGYASGELDPANPCESCQPSASTTEWTALPDGRACGGPGGGSCRTHACVMPASCAPGGAGMTNCGSGGSGTESCCTSLEVTGGTFDRTYSNGGVGPMNGADSATVSAFRLDKYEVTVGRFRQFVDAWTTSGTSVQPNPGAGKHLHLHGGQGLSYVTSPSSYEPGWLAASDPNISPTTANLTEGVPYSTWTASPGASENLPINTVTWAEAYAFCIWDGGFLPSEAEWEYAAAGGAVELEYPWGNAAPGNASTFAIYGCLYPAGASGMCGGTNSNQAPVGTTLDGAGLFGQFDLAGNTEEWTLDFYATPYVSPSDDAANFVASNQRVARGGEYNADLAQLEPPYRDTSNPTQRSWGVGMRCARSP